MTRADFTTCGRNILPSPNGSPTTFMPSISGPSITSIGRPPRGDLLAHLFGVLDDEGGNAVHQRVRQARLDGGGAPGQVFFLLGAGALHRVGELHQALGGRAFVVGLGLAYRLGAVQHHVLDQVAQLGIQVGVHAELAGVDDAHRHSFLTA